jgi:hypothetical protein
MVIKKIETTEETPETDSKRLQPRENESQKVGSTSRTGSKAGPIRICG